MNYVATNAQYITSYRCIKATSHNKSRSRKQVLKKMNNEEELKIKQERSDFQDAKNHSTKLHLVLCISAATSRLLRN